MARIKQMNKTIYAKEPIIVRGLAEQIGIKIYQLMHDFDGYEHLCQQHQPVHPARGGVGSLCEIRV
jgi:hypothetical protein